MRRRRSSALLVLAACHHAAPATPAPRACPTGAVVIAGQDDVAHLAGCARVAGLAIRTGGQLDLAPLASLRAIDGDLVVGPSVGLAEVTLAGLVDVRGTLRIVSNQTIHGAYFPALASAGGLEVAANVSLATLSLPKLARVEHDVAIGDSDALELFEASALASIGGDLAIARAPELALAELGALAHVAHVRIDGAPKLDAAVLTRVRGLAP